MSAKPKVTRKTPAARAKGQDGSDPSAPATSEQETLIKVGQRLRGVRLDQRKTLEWLAEKTDLSVSMLSLVERGKASPSLGTLISVCSALDVQMSDLFGASEEIDREAVIRNDDHPEFQTAAGVIRRVIRADHKRNIELVVNEFQPGAASDTKPRPHSGYEYGLLLNGKLVVELDGEECHLAAGDSISYESTRPHRLMNKSGREAIAVWVNVHH